MKKVKLKRPIHSYNKETGDFIKTHIDNSTINPKLGNNIKISLKRIQSCNGFMWSYELKDNFYKTKDGTEFIKRQNIKEEKKKAENIFYVEKEEEEEIKEVEQSENIIYINKGLNIENSKKSSIKKIAEIYSIKELEAIANGGRILAGTQSIPDINFAGQRIRCGFITDTHIGSKFTNERHFELCNKEFKKENVDFIALSGDVTEGMSNRDGHVYELDYIGYDAQKRYAIELLSSFNKPIYAISGNHDRWFIKSNGADIVKDISREVKDMSFIGHDTGFINLKDKANIQLHHGEDGSSYATSYRIQKIIESLSGGTKPHAMFFGHVHKQGYFFDRNIHCVSGGSIQMQTNWMRSKRLGAHTGFHIIDIWVNNKGISKFTVTWYPFYA